MTFDRPRWWRQRFVRAGREETPPVIVITDLDAATIEQSRTDQRAALDFLAEHAIPLVINSNRTRTQIERLHRTLQIAAPFISENGGALFLPQGCFPVVPDRARLAIGFDVVEFGKPYFCVVSVLRETCQDLRIEVVRLSELSIEEAARELKLPLLEARLAKLREYSEIFRLVGVDDRTRSRLFRALRQQRLRCWQTSAEDFIACSGDRAEAVRVLRAVWKQAWGDPLIVGLGDTEDDVAWLSEVDVPVVIQNERTGVPSRVLSKLPTAHVTSACGARGWSDAIFEFVGELVLTKRPVGSR